MTSRKAKGNVPEETQPIPDGQCVRVSWSAVLFW